MLCSKCNHEMGRIDARRPGQYPRELLDYWPNCPDCAAGGPWCAAALLPARPPRGRRYSVYLSDDVFAAAKASGLPYAELVRRGLERGESAGKPIDVATLERVLGEELRAHLSGHE